MGYKKERGLPAADGSSKAIALLEVLTVCAAFILLAHLAIASVNLEAIMPTRLGEPERGVGAIFLAGASAQIILVLAFAQVSSDLRRVISNSLAPGNSQAWTIAIIAVTIHSATIGFLFLESPGQIVEPSLKNLLLSAIPALDGWSQEVLFRGYVIYRLARGGVAVPVIYFMSAASFSAIHIGYIGEGFLEAFWPMFGTAVLGLFFTRAVLVAKGALLPVVACHCILVAIIQPWLALA